MDETPDTGDILITSDGSGHSVSVVPNRSQVRYDRLGPAIAIARRVARIGHVRVWHTSDGRSFRRVHDSEAA
jgi:hypothetical protein